MPRPIFPDEPIRFGPDADQPFSLSPHAKKPSQNPLVRVYGAGPAGTTCGSCSLLYKVNHGSRSYLKCALRQETRGAGSDHRAGWRSCAMYTTTPREKPWDEGSMNL